MLWDEAVQLCGAVTFFICGAGWIWAGLMRRRERMRQQPQVSVVLPVKGYSPRNLASWRSHLGSAYPGALEFIFVVESVRDPAYAHLQALAASCGQDVKVRVAGLASTCSQKIFNLVAGVRFSNPASRYVLFVDDDVELHPGSIGELTGALEQDASLFMATGFPFDVAPPGSGLAAYCTLAFHVGPLIGFSASQRSAIVWGGCMMLRTEELRKDTYNVLRDWVQGGYSDDLLLAAKCSEHGLVVAVPSAAVFPQWLEPNTTWSWYINYIHRQLYTMDTYVTPHNRAVNHLMLAGLTLASAASTLPLVAGAFRMAVFLCRAVYCSWGPASGQPHLLPVAAAFCSSPVWDWGRDWAAATYVASLVFAHCGLYFCSAQVLSLFRVLSPERPHLRLGQINWAKLWAGIFIQGMLVPVLALYTLFQPHVEWGWIWYRKRAGRVIALGVGPNWQSARLEGASVGDATAAADGGAGPAPTAASAGPDAPPPFAVDTSKPLVFEVGKLGARYWEWVARPELGRPRYFGNPFLEGCTKVTWWVVPLLWLPVFTALLAYSAVTFQLGASALVSHVLFGVVAWQGIEYTLHRFLFHAHSTSYVGITIHFIFHGGHHKFPNDGERLVFPPVPAACIVALIYCLLSALMPLRHALPFGAGIGFGYVAYDCLHYLIHHAGKGSLMHKLPLLRELHTRHMHHHYRDSTTGYGISSTLFDVVMGTSAAL